MQNPLDRYKLIIKRWAWMMILGIIICGGITYAASKLVHPKYQASSTLILNVCTAQSTPYDCTTAGLEALPTYAQLITSPEVLNPVVAHHPGLTLKQLTGMIAVKPQSNTLLMNVDVTYSDPELAAQLANEVSQSFAAFTNTQLPGRVQVIPAQVPTDPVGLRSSYAAVVGALVGLGLALALIVIFEWVDDRLSKPEEIEDLLGKDVLASIPQLKSKQLTANPESLPVLAERCRILCANLNAAQAINPFKLVMVTSALAGEGKSVVAANLASFMALSGKRVLLVDANLRRPMLGQYFGLDNHDSLASALHRIWGKANIELDGQLSDIPTLRILTAGATSSNPAELLQSTAAVSIFKYFQDTQDFDYIIFDTPALLPVADAQVLASYMQAGIFVVDASKTPRKVLLRARQVLKRLPISLVGVVINKNPWPDYSTTYVYQDQVYEQYTEPDKLMVEPKLPDTPVPALEDDDIDTDVTVQIHRLDSSELPRLNRSDHQ